MALLRVISTPRAANAAVVAAKAIGAASDSAQGQVTTSTATAANSALAGCAGSIHSQAAALASANSNTAPSRWLA